MTKATWDSCIAGVACSIFFTFGLISLQDFAVLCELSRYMKPSHSGSGSTSLVRTPCLASLGAGAALATCLLVCGTGAFGAGAHPSVWVYPGPSDDLVYATDVSGIRLNDYSECGYQRGQVELPNVTNVIDSSRWVFLSPLGGGQEDGPNINAALNNVGTFTVNSNGFRGVVLLGPGVYVMRAGNPLIISNSGVVLKGSPGFSSWLYATNEGAFTMIQIQGSGDHAVDTQKVAWFTEPFVPAGTRTFRVNATNGFAVGDAISVHHDTSASWIHSINMDLLGEDQHPWPPGAYDQDYDRFITRIEGNWVTVDTPIPQTYDSQYSYGHIAHYTGPNAVQNCAVEDLVCFTGASTEDESNPNSAVRILKAANGWVRHLVASGYFSSAVSVGGFSKFVTVAQCTNLTSVFSNVHFRYSFYLEKTDEPQYVLMRDCYSDNSRHSFVLGSVVPGPNAFVRCDAANSDDETGPHERWSTGTLFDNVRELGGQLISIAGHEIGVENRGNSGAGGSYHGWTAGFTTVWNCYAEDGFRVRNPPGARNWLIGSDGDEKTSRHGCWYGNIPFMPSGDCWAVGADPDGTYDQSGSGSPPVQLHSLYYAQLQQRLKWPQSQFREYRLGDIGWNPGGDNGIYVDPNWAIAMQLTAGPDATVVSDFDSLALTQWTAFSFKFPIATNERVVAGWLSLSLSYSPGDHHLFVETTNNAISFTNIGWVPSTDGAVRYTYPLAAEDLWDGQLNVALDAGCGVDFAILNVQVAPILPTYDQTWYPIDTYVRDGSYANQNFFTDTELWVKKDNDAGFSRRAFLFWDLSQAGQGLPPLVSAKVRLYCQGSGQAGDEESVSVVPSDSWDPQTVTWNTQPNREPPFAYWVPDGAGFYSEFAVTPQVLATLADNKHFSLCIDSAADWGAAGDVAYSSTKDPDPTHWPQLVLSFGNTPPTIAGPPNQSMSANSTLGPLPVTVGDAETPASALILSALSSDQTVIADSEILLGGSGADRTISITVPSGRSGASFITLQVSDGAEVTTTSFRVVVSCFTIFPPALSLLTNQVFYQDTVRTVPFNTGSQCSGPDALYYFVSATNHQLFPSGSFQVVPHAGLYNRALIMTPAPGQTGSTYVHLSVSDGTHATNRTFLTTVRPVPPVQHPPQYVRITNPRAGDNFPPGVPVLLSAEAYDVETNLDHIEFYTQPSQLLGMASNAPYSFTWTNPPAGTSVLYAVAYDTNGLSAVSPSVQVAFSVPVPYQPLVYIAQSSNLVVLAWSDLLSSNALQTATNLVPPIQWAPLTNVALDGEGAWFYFTSPTNRQQFYRLAQ